MDQDYQLDENQKKALDGILDALSFYANSKIYWGRPIPLELNLDRRTLKICHEHHKDCEVLKDFGEIAREALKNFEENFECEYEVRTEI